MAALVEVLRDDAPAAGRRLAVVGAGLLVALVGGGAWLRSTLPPPPLAVSLASVSGTALEGDGFVRVVLELEAQGARDVADTELTVAGTAEPGRHLGDFDGAGRLKVQVDVTPDCAVVAAGAAPAELALDVRAETGERQHVVLVVPPGGPLDRLMRHPCPTS